MATMTRDQALKRAREIGITAPVDMVPEMTDWGLALWKENLMEFFGCAADNLTAGSGMIEEMRPEILSAMKEGFKTLMGSQPLDASQRTTVTKLVDLVFDKELPVHPHHCTH